MNINNKKILFVVGDFCEMVEICTAYKALKSLGFHCDTVSPGKKQGDKFMTALHEFQPEFQTYTEKQGNSFGISADIDSINLNEYAGLWLPGGRAPEYLKTNKRVLEIVKTFLD